MRTWVIFALLSVIVAAAQQGEAAAVHEPAILHVIGAIDKGIKKVQSWLPGNDKEETTAEKSLLVLPGIRGPLGHFGALFPGHHFPHGRKPVKPTPEAPVVDEDNEDINVVDNDDVNEEDNEDVPADEEADGEVADDQEVADNEEADEKEADDEAADDEEADDEEAADKVADDDKDAEDDDDSDEDDDDSDEDDDDDDDN